VRFALVGCGSISKKHIVSIERLEEAELAAVCDLSAGAAKVVGEECDVPHYTSAREMAERESFDVFSILTPSGSHAADILQLADFGRHFVVEKPLALRVEDADRVVEACDGRGLQVFLVHQNRFNRPILKLREAIDAGRFGKMVLGTIRVRWSRRQDYYDAKPWRGTWAEDGGVLTNQASHHLDMLTWLLGDVEAVTARTSTRLADIEAEDTGAAILEFGDGAIGIVEATTATRPRDLEGSISVLGEKGSVEVGGFFMNELKTWEFEEPLPDDARVFDDWGSNPAEWAWNHTEYLRDVAHGIRHGNPALVGGLEGRKSLELITAIYESAETGRRVPLRFRPERCRLGGR